MQLFGEENFKSYEFGFKAGNFTRAADFLFLFNKDIQKKEHFQKSMVRYLNLLPP